jgi:enoyl-CoA hydratase
MKIYQMIQVEKRWQDHSHIALVKLNRPKVLNALCSDLMRELIEALMELDHDEQTRVIVLTGDERAFAAGADIAEMQGETPVTKIQHNKFRSWDQLSLLTKPLIAAVNGFALGGGCELAMSCDFILAGDKAQFGQPEIKIGTIPGAGGTQRLTHAFGKSKAMFYILTGKMISASEALAHGLVAQVYPSETLMTETFEVAKTIASYAPMSLKLAKKSVNAAFNMSLRDGLDYERHNFYMTFSSEDQKEGMRAFVEKRPPTFTGK